MPGRSVRLDGLLLLCSVFLATAAPATERDRFIEGYATAVLERDLGLAPIAVELFDGVLVVHLDTLGSEPESRVIAALQEIRGVDHVEIRLPPPDSLGADAALPETAVVEPSEHEKGTGFEVLPRRELFEPLMADVRWPRFSASFLSHLDDDELTHVGSANFGESFALLAGDLGEASRWEFGLQAAVFSIFDLDADSNDLVNSDFYVGPTLSMRSGRFTGLLRFFHQSSHVGDEYLLRNNPKRVNLSYEGIDTILSFDLNEAIRVYGGGGVLVHTVPNLDPLSAQTGLELESPWAVLGDIVRPVAGADLRWAEQDDWHMDVSLRAGLQLENPRLSKLRLRALFEYFQGQSPNGQFFERRIEYMGVGLQLDL